MFVVISVSIFVALCLLYFVRFKKNGPGMPPGPWEWPILGTLPQLALAHPSLPHLQFSNLAQKYGDVMSIKLGIHKGVHLNSFEAIRDLMGRDEFSGRFDSFPFATDRSFHKILGLVFTSGNTQKELRRFTLRNLRDVGFGKSNSMAATLEAELAEFTKLFDSKLTEANGIMTIEPNLFALSFVNVIWCFVAGYRFSHGNVKLNKILKYTDAVIESWKLDNPSVPFPILRHLFPEWTGYNHQMKVATDIHQYIKELLDEIKDKYVQRGGAPKSFIECFIQEIITSGNDKESTFTEQQLIMVMEDLFIGGSETTSIMMSYAILFMVLHPDVQEKVQVEIDAVIDKDSIPTTADLAQMPYTMGTVEEIFRLSHIAPMPVARKCMADFVYRNYLIPAGTAVFFNTAAVMMDKQHWGDPELFRPDRFLDSTGTKVVNTERNLPFGYGKRVCIAENVARESFSIYFATFMKKYKFSIPPGQKAPSAVPLVKFTLRPQLFEAFISPRV